MPLPSMEMKTSENKLFEDGEATDADNTLPLDTSIVLKKFLAYIENELLK